MTPLALLLDLADRGIWLAVQDDKLEVNAPKDALTQQDRVALATQRDELLRIVPPTECPSCGNDNPSRWWFNRFGRKCWACGWTRLYLKEVKA